MVLTDSMPADPDVFVHWTWANYQPYVDQLLAADLSEQSVAEFLTRWSALSARIEETYFRLYVAIVCNTADEAAAAAFHRFLDEVYPPAQEADQQIKEKFLASGLAPPGFEVPLQKMRAQAELFRTENIPLQTEEAKLNERFDQIAGAETVEWDGEERTLEQVAPAFQDPNRSVRERAWRAVRGRQLEDREAFNDLWRQFLSVRLQMAANAGKPDYRAYRWQQMLRFDYTPENTKQFDRAILEVVVPAAVRLREERRRELGVDTLRPWDLEVDPLGRPALQPFTEVDQLVARTNDIFQQVDPALGGYFDIMRREQLLDLASRKNKGPGGFCGEFAVRNLPFIFMNAVGLPDDVNTMLHEGGHAFHVFETGHLPWVQQRSVGLEFAEVASMAMELLASPYLAGEFYTEAEAARARRDHLIRTVLFWPYMAVVDSFQHWVYEHPEEAAEPANCDRAWMDLYRRYHPDEDWSGLDAELMTGWQRKPHIFSVPFYYVEYGLAQLGAVQVWANARRDQAEAVARYRQALALGGTRSIPELYEAAGARFGFDAELLQSVIDLMQQVIDELAAPAAA